MWASDSTGVVVRTKVKAGAPGTADSEPPAVADPDVPVRTQPVRFNPASSGQARNRPCPCGSNKKTKRCCLVRVDAERAKRSAAAREAGKVVMWRAEVK